MSLKSTAAVTEQSQSERPEEVRELETSQTISVSQPPAAPLTFSTAPTWFATDTPVLSERPPEGVAPPQVSPDRAAAMKRIVLVTVGVCFVIVLVAGWRLVQHRRAKAMEQTMAMVTSPSPTPETLAPPPPRGEGASVASPNAASSAQPSSIDTPATSTTTPRAKAPLRHAPARTVRNHGTAPRKAPRKF